MTVEEGEERGKAKERRSETPINVLTSLQVMDEWRGSSHCRLVLNNF